MTAENKKQKNKKVDASDINSSIRNAAVTQLTNSTKISSKSKMHTTEDLVHELQVHQIELEMQAEELRRAHLLLEESRDRYLDLYEFAPLGYLTLTDKGMITEANLTSASLLNIDRNKLLKTKFSKFIAEKDYDQWYRYFANVLNQNEKQTCSLTLKRGDGPEFPARLEGIQIVEIDEGIPKVRMAISDITDIKQVADALSESRERYRAILDQAADAIFIDDATGRIIDVNLKACQSLGYSRDELLSKSIKEIDQDAAKAAIHHELRSKAIPDGGYTFESRYRRKDGSIIPVEETVGPLRLPHGPATIRMIRDTTERRRAEAYREITREVLQILNQPGSLQDLLKNVVVALKLSTGADAAGIRLQNKDDFPYFFQEGFSNDFLNKENSLINRSSDGICKDSTGQPSLECTCGLVISGRTDPSNPLFTQGGSFWTNNSFPLLDLPDNEDPRILPRNECIHQGYVSIALIPIRSESRIVGLIQLNDRKKGCFTREGVESLEVIAESIGMAVLRKQAEEALSESESRYHNLVDSANEAIVVAQDGMLRFVNPAALALIGVSEQELTSTPFVTFIHPDDSTMVAERFQKRSQGEAVPARYVFRIITKRGDTRWVEMNAIAIDWEERPATLNFMTDITEHKKMVEELRRSNTELQQFAYVASHDLQEPLRMVVSYLTLLEKKYRDKLDPGAQEFIHYAVDGGNRMRNLIDDLLEYSRVDTKSKEFVLVDMNDVVARTLANISVVIEESKAEILVDSLPTIVADKSQMVQVMQNLVSNAIKFRGPDRPKISISAPIKSGEWTIAVKDNGIGLSMEFSEKIFLMFQRLHTAREYPGTGVGLAIAKKIIDRHGGHIWVESKEGNGSTFFFSIPRNRRTD